MPHAARKKSASGYYHVVSKAIASQLIFENDADRRYYLELLSKAICDTSCEVLSYCLMSNHVHLVVNDVFHAGAHTELMKYVDERYGTFFADKTKRCGGIFQRPFWSEPIETDEYLLCAIRYVHANPVVAGISDMFDYEWSSARDYTSRRGLASTDLVLGMCDSKEAFVRFSLQPHGYARAFPTSRLFGHVTDDEALRLARLVLGAEKLRTIGSFQPRERNEGIRQLKKSGLTIRQIQRVTGLGHYLIQQA